jgi:hypothetical protein
MIESIGSSIIPGAIVKQEEPKYTPVSFNKRKLEKIEPSGVAIGKDGIWKNKSAEIIKHINCYVPYSLVELMRAAEYYADTKNIEFGLYLKGKLENKTLHVTNEFMVPKQNVTSVHIDFLEDEGKKLEFNGVIHRHPNGVKGFSGTDDTYINQNYLFSLLYIEKEITKGIINFDIPNVGRVQMELNIIYSIPYIEQLKQFENKIFKEEHVANKNNDVFLYNDMMGGMIQGHNNFPFQKTEHLKAAGIKSFNDDETGIIENKLDNFQPFSFDPNNNDFEEKQFNEY